LTIKRSRYGSLDESNNQAEFLRRAKAVNQQVEALKKEADDLAAQAEKVQKENPDSFRHRIVDMA